MAVAMSGGVDSSAAAALLKEQGHDVFGLTAKTWPEGSRCCSDEDIRDARRVAAAIGIPHYVVDLSEVFDKEVVTYFVAEYIGGRTPSPCVRCNRYVKFGALMDKALALGAEQMATGHYARIRRDDDGRLHLLMGVDSAKDQSYFLFDLSQEQLARSLFPVGGMRKEAVREVVRLSGLPVHDRPESQDLCFVQAGAHHALIERRQPEAQRSGVIRDLDGRELGVHDGIHRFTIGQRRGLGIAAGAPRYVVALDAETHTVTVGDKQAVMHVGARVSGIRWTGGLPVVGGACRVQAKIRYAQEAAAATLDLIADGLADLRFDEPQFAVTPGQVAVFYVGDELIGGGWIESAIAWKPGA
jgi:tRNA-specific 2-thiouridylase